MRAESFSQGSPIRTHQQGRYRDGCGVAALHKTVDSSRGGRGGFVPVVTDETVTIHGRRNARGPRSRAGEKICRILRKPRAHGDLWRNHVGLPPDVHEGARVQKGGGVGVFQTYRVRSGVGLSVCILIRAQARQKADGTRPVTGSISNGGMAERAQNWSVSHLSISPPAPSERRGGRVPANLRGARDGVLRTVAKWNG